MTEPETLLFPDRRIDGAFLVTDPEGNPVAKVTAAWSGGRFTVTSVDGGTLSEGVTSRWWLTGKWDVTDGDGAPLLTMTAKSLRNAAAVDLACGGRLVVSGSAWRRGFVVVDQDGHTVLSGAPRNAVLSPRQHNYAVQRPTPGALSLAEVIAIVQVWRMVKKSEVAVIAATTSTVTAAGA